MSRKIDTYKFITLKEVIEIERKRLIEIKNSDNGWWKDKRRSDWARKMFGETLIERSSEEIFKKSPEYLNENCSVCGKLPSLNEKLLNLSFSFCDEHGCGMTICKDCISNFNDLFYKNIA